jgi:hypothetical protein
MCPNLPRFVNGETLDDDFDRSGDLVEQLHRMHRWQ